MRERPPTFRFGRTDGLMLGYVFVMMGTGALLISRSEKDMIFPVGGGGMILAGLVSALFGLMQPARSIKPEPRNKFARFFFGSFMLMFVAFVFIGGELGLKQHWMGIVGMLLAAPFVVALLMLAWFIPHEARKAAANAAEAK